MPTAHRPPRPCVEPWQSAKVVYFEKMNHTPQPYAMFDMG